MSTVTHGKVIPSFGTSGLDLPSLPGVPEGQHQGRVLDIGLPLLGRLPVQVPAGC